MTCWWAELICPRCGSKNVTAHAHTLPAKGEADVWVPVRDEGYRCSDCTFLESCLNNAGDEYAAFRTRWNDPIKTLSVEEHNASIAKIDRIYEQQDREWTWPDEDLAFRVKDRESRTDWLSYLAENRSYWVFERDEDHEVKQLPIHAELMAQIVADPESDAPRWAYARWLREQEHRMASVAADFIEWQLRLAESFRNDARADIRDQLPVRAFAKREPRTDAPPDAQWWRSMRNPDYYQAMHSYMGALRDAGLIADEHPYRGFVEHVAIKAQRFLEIADELYSLAPIRQLTITYCKGFEHNDTGLLKALLDSPYLDRIRALKLPVRKFGQDKGEYTKLNVLSDDDIALLATSRHLRGLRYLALDDQTRLTIRAFDAIATSSNLPELSAVTHDIYRYSYPASFAGRNLGGEQRTLALRPLKDYTPELEARHGRLPWLHVAEEYGSETPDVEAVVEHPIPRGGL